jgi:hypothetical protein
MFSSPDLARLCNSQARLKGWTADPSSLMRLLNELDCIDRLDDVARLPHVDVIGSRSSRVAVCAPDGAFVLLKPEKVPDRGSAQADSAIVLAVAVGTEECNPEGERWPRGFALSPTTR